MSEHPNIDALLEKVNKLKKLLEHPEPGLFTWHEAVANLRFSIAGIVPPTSKDIRD